MVAANSDEQIADWKTPVWWHKADSWEEYFAALERYKDAKAEVINVAKNT